ncbi:MAG TPA: 1-acyl-sn-glycerol-3-phosphate acyltransferase [Solirubrobacterales bacterium]|nr:1-acyl-sn-glycerol-3-phosphate acyltransferase [Solirubrobacterales bacterium]
MRVKTPGPGPLFPDQGPFLPRMIRRIVGITVEVLAFVLMTVLFPVLLLAAAIVDLTLWLTRRKPWVSVRLLPALWCFLFGEIEALVKLPVIYVLTGGPFGRGSIRRRRWIYVLRIRWARNHLGAVRALFGLKIEVEDLELTAQGPFILMIRHASIIDNLLPDVLIGHTYGIGVRFVIKREIQTLPAIDIGGRWIPTVFIRRGSLDPDTEIAAVRALTHEMSPGEILGIYPEGTRPTPAKIKRAQEVIAERQPEVAPFAAKLNHLLPPRLGGPLALIDEAAAGTDIVFCAHTGFDGLRTVGDIWAGELVDKTIKVRFWRYEGGEIPEGEAARIEWLYGCWQVLDDWVGENLEAG